MNRPFITQTFLNTIEKHSLVSKGDTLIVGYSGGADSTALLHLLHSLPGYELTLIAVHLNHRLRGDDSDKDEEFCRENAHKLGIQFESKQVNVQEIARIQRINLEDAGRQSRFRFFDDLMITYGAAAIVLAHHADDQAETVLMRLLRGSGMTGLSGIGHRNSKGYIRPLLDIPANDLRNWLREQDIPWREDASNADTTYLRNRIRHVLIPLLQTWNPSTVATINAAADIITEDNNLLHEYALDTFKQLCLITPASVQCSTAGLLSLHRSLIRRIIRLMYEQVSGTLHGFGRIHCEDCIELCRSMAANTSISLPHGIVARKEYNTLVISHTTKADTLSKETTISGFGTYPLWDGLNISIAEAEQDDDIFNTQSGCTIVDYDMTPFPWQIRTFRPGDRIHPFGMNGHKKIKDLFIDLKIPLQERNRIPLFFANNELFWVGGLRLSTPATVTNNTTHRIRISIQS